MEIEADLTILDWTSILNAGSVLVEEVSNTTSNTMVRSRTELTVNIIAVRNTKSSVENERVVGDTSSTGTEVMACCAVSNHALTAVYNTSTIHKIVSIDTFLADSRLATTKTLCLRTRGITMLLISRENVICNTALASCDVLTCSTVRNGATDSRTTI